MPRPDVDAVALLEQWLELAREGVVRDVVLVARLSDGEYDEGYTIDLTKYNEMIFELRSTVIRLQVAARDRSEVKKDHEH